MTVTVTGEIRRWSMVCEWREGQGGESEKGVWVAVGDDGVWMRGMGESEGGRKSTRARTRARERE